MKISSDEMYISGAYYKNNPDWDIADAPWKAEIIYQLLKKNNIHPETVIETGCGAGYNLVELQKKEKGFTKLTGYDISPQAIELAKINSTENIRFLNEDITLTDKASSDLMLVIDVIEHVDDYYGFLRKLKSKSSYFVFHIPLDLAARTIMKPHVLLQQRSSVGHIHYFTKETAWWALTDTGYEIIDWTYTKPVVDVKKANSVKRWVKKCLRNLSFALNKDWSAKKWGGYSVMVLAK